MSESGLKPLRILAADDEGAVLNCYAEALRHAPVPASVRLGDMKARLFPGAGEPQTPPEPPAEVVLCRQGDEAIEAVRIARESGRPFAVALLDVRMPPGPDGVTAAEQIRAIDPEVEIVIVTAYSDIEPAEIARRVPPLDRLLYVQKPFHLHEIRQFTASLGAKWRSRAALEQAHQKLAAELEARRTADGDRARLLQAVEQASDSVLITDTEGRIVYLNSAFERITGFRRADAIGKTPRILRSGRQQPQTYRELWTTILRGETWSGRLVNRRKDGGVYDAFTTISPVLDDGGRIVSFLAVSRDVTRESALEAELRVKARMELLGSLAGSVAHDFNNILSVILCYAEFLREDLGEGNELRERVVEIEQAADRGAALTHQLLAFSRKQVLDPHDLNPNDVVGGMERMLRRLLPPDIEAIFDLTTAECSIRADKTQIEQVVMNLCVNARDAMPDGGRLRIKTSCVDLRENDPSLSPGRPPGPYVVLSVSDTGCGMDAETLARIFEPFFTTKKDHGTGLGLATVYGIVDQSGGYIRVDSTPGAGARFDVYLPRTRNESRASESVESHAAAPTGSGTVLVVDDSDHFRRIASDGLARLGYEVLVAATGEAAVELTQARGGAIDIAILDVVLPGMSGPQTLIRLREIAPAIQALLVSGHPDDTRWIDEVRAGTRFLRKPFKLTALAREIRSILGARRSSPTAPQPPA